VRDLSLVLAIGLVIEAMEAGLFLSGSELTLSDHPLILAIALQ
jgi:hypothetical protein